MSKTNNNDVSLWRGRIEACKTSNLSIKSWCRENSINPSVYHYWFKKLNYKIENTETKWAEIKIEPEKKLSSLESPIIVHFHDFKIEIPRNFEKAAIVEVLSAIHSIC